MNVAMNIEPRFLLSELLVDFAVIETDMQVSGLALNSAEVRSGDVFFALPGAQCHGMAFAKEAINKGAVAVVYDPDGVSIDDVDNGQLTDQIAIPSLAEKLSEIAARFYGHPATKLQVIGITGTNGKTSCSQFLAQALSDCGIIGTLGWGRWGGLKPTINTTPDAITLQKLLAELVSLKQKHVAMEVSSHGLAQGRVNGINFNAAILTNISRDHLDYHGSMQAYVAVKMQLLKTPGLQYVVLNLDDQYSESLITEISESVEIIGVSKRGRKLQRAEVLHADNIVCKDDGVHFELVWQQQRIQVAVLVYGEFNVDNLLIVLAVMLGNGIALEKAVERVRLIRPIPGRMESFQFGKGAARVFIDYAHTPDALKNVLISARAYSQKKLWLVFGCGGNRDQGKRALMGSIAEQYADQIIITDDNPRSENAEVIVSDILSGCTNKSIEIIHEREMAIRTAIQQAGPGDCVVIAGKGHETYQEIAGDRVYFSDRKLLKEMILAYRDKL